MNTNLAKTILLTGATDGIGLATARMLVAKGHTVLLHGRSPEKLEKVEQMLSELPGGGQVKSYVADLSRMIDVKNLVKSVTEDFSAIDVLINNAGVYNINNALSPDGLDTRFVVNTISPYLLTKGLLPLLGASGRVVNLSSAAQAPLMPESLRVPSNDSDGMVYAQSKLALTMWTRSMSESLKDDGPMIVAVNPKSMLGSKMVKEAYGVNGADLNLGADILCRASLSDEFANAFGQYFDNDIGRFSSPHPDALDLVKCDRIVAAIEAVLDKVA